MQYFTLASIISRINNECDLSDQGFIDSDELLSYINAAIKDCEAIIHTLYEDYFLVRGQLTLISGQSAYSAPSDIFATKIRSLTYNDTTRLVSYEIRRILHLHEIPQYTASNLAPYRFVVTNTLTDGVKINLYPTPAESGPLIDCWYIRNSNTLVEETDACDIPEFIEFIFSNLKWRIARKEKYGVDLETAKSEYMVQKDLLESTLRDMIPDESSNLIEKDMSFYTDFDSNLIDGMNRR